MTVRYSMTLEDYQLYICHLAGKTIEKKQSSMTMLGVLLIGMAVIFFFLGPFATMGIFGYFMAGILLLSGVYNLLFYKVIYFSAIKKTAAKSFHKRKYDDMTVEVKLLPDKIINILHNEKESFEWRDVRFIDETENAFYIMLAENRGIILPKRACPDAAELGKQMNQFYLAQKQEDEARPAEEEKRTEEPEQKVENLNVGEKDPGEQPKKEQTEDTESPEGTSSGEDAE